MTGTELAPKLSAEGLKVLAEEAKNLSVKLLEALDKLDPQVGQVMRNAWFDLNDHPTDASIVTRAVGKVEEAIPIAKALVARGGSGVKDVRIWNLMLEQYEGRLEELSDAVLWVGHGVSGAAVGVGVTLATLLGVGAGLLIRRR